MDPIRVLHILHSMNRGGAENALMNYYREIDRSKVQFDFLLTDPNHCLFEDEILDLGGFVYRVPPLSIHHPFGYLKGLSAFFKSHPEYKIVHSHTSSKSVFPLLVAKIYGIPVRISHSHTSLSERGVKGVIRNLLMPFLKVTANVYMACAERAGEWLYGKIFFEQGHVEVVRNVIDAGLFRYDEDKRVKMRKELNVSEDTLIVGHVARFSIPKNHIFALEVFKDLLKKKTNSLYLLVGDGELKPEIESRIQELGIFDKVRMVGVVSNVFDYVQAMDVFVLPSLCEGLPLSIIEAQVSGLPCVTTAGTVSTECSVTNLVTYVSLSESPTVWADAYLKASQIPRRDRYEEIKNAGYDSKTSALELQNRYIELYRLVSC